MGMHKMLAGAKSLKPLPLRMGIKPSAAIHSHPEAVESPWCWQHLLNFWAVQESHGLAAAPTVVEGLLYHPTPYCKAGGSLGWWEEGLGRDTRETSEEDN